MNAFRPPPQNLTGLPTLTEVIEFAAPAVEPGVDAVGTPPSEPLAAEVETDAMPAAAAPAPAIDEEQIVQRVLTDLQRHADLMFEYRLREALAPVLAKLTDALIHDVRDELAATLRDVVSRAVSQELARQRSR
jgi:hypothetical protein